MMKYLNVRFTFWTSEVRPEVILRLLVIIQLIHGVIPTPYQLSSAVPTVHFIIGIEYMSAGDVLGLGAEITSIRF